MGNSEVGHLTIGSGRILYQDLQRVNRAIATARSSRTRRCSARSSAASAADVHLLGLVSHGGVHSHIDHLQALLELARAGMEERTWIHAFTDGRDVSPHAAVADLAELPRTDRDGRRPLLRDGPRQALGADAARARRDRHGAGADTGRCETCRRATTRASPTSSSSRSSSTAARARPRRRGDLLQLPARPRPPALAKLARGGFDLTTMTRYRDELDVPVAFGEQTVRTRSPRCSPARRAQLHVAETEKYAHVTYFFNGGVEEEWPGETRILVPSPRDVRATTTSRRCRARGRRAFCAEIGDGYRFAVDQLREPGHGRPHGLDPGRDEAVEDATSASARRRGDAAAAASASSRPTTATPSRCSSRTASARTPAHTTNPVPLILT
jgi:2,3-bisphosphoglycerate-independent phosphoglycerate mutase